MPILALLLAAGCTSAVAPHPQHLSSRDVNIRQCAAWYESLDAAVDAAGVRDGGEARVAGSPHLRVNRFLAAFRTQIVNDDSPLAHVWLAAMAALDVDARAAEIANLRTSSGNTDSNAPLQQELLRCGDLLRRVDRASAIAPHAAVDDDYSTTKRALGLYGVIRVPFFVGVTAWQDRARQAFAAGAALPVSRYTPPRAPMREAAVARFTEASRDALGVPVLSANDWRALFDAYAPEIEVETSGAYDQIGALTWDASRLVLNAAVPTVYQRVSYTRIAGKTHTQLNYSFWFSERPAASVFDVVAGSLDGVIFRVTLDRAGQVLIYDTIHSCGCYHLFFPTESVRTKPAPNDHEEWAFVPRAAPTLAATERIAIRLQSRSHYVVGIDAVSPANGIAYQWRDDRELRALPLLDGTTKSIFSIDGIISGSERGERWLFWPMGVASAGAMRQWGRHATAFVGKRHFDDADLFERRFEISGGR